MGYTTNFRGSFQLNKPLQSKIKEFLIKLAETRRMARKVDEAFGVEGEFFVFGEGELGQKKDESIIDYNREPKTQPGLWCQWIPNENGTAIEWDGNEKFYNYTDWLFYLINKILAPNGYVLNGSVIWQGEKIGDVGKIHVKDNVITVAPWDEKEYILTDDKLIKYIYGVGEVVNYMRTDVVLIIQEKKFRRRIKF